MKYSHQRSLVLLLLLVAAGIAGLILTRPRGSAPGQDKSLEASSAENGLINQQYLETARRLSVLATTQNEVALAQDALRVTDRELDMQFAAALQTTAHAPILQTPEVRSIQAEIARTGRAIQAKEDEVQGLTDALKTARASQRDSVQEQLDVSQAELNLYKETLADAQEDLIRAGGDPHSRVQQLVDEHNASSHAVESVKFNPSSPTSQPASLMQKFSVWNTLWQGQADLAVAQQDAYNAAAVLAKSHDNLEREDQAQQAKRKSVPAPSLTPSAPAENASAGNTTTGNATAPPSPSGSAEKISSIKRLSEDRKAMAILDKRIQGMQELGADYDKWGALVRADDLVALHGVIESVFWIVVMLLVMFVVNRTTEHFFSRLTLEVKQRTTLQAVIRIGIQGLTVVVILIVIFGPPNQLSTVLGLAGAGLTVVLKDFIVSFLGWFVLMGRHGLRVGDWVEINGVRGEVIEISLLRTILLETGNWTDAGQPTGRQVGFLNQYAIDGYYFNFSTSGQWLWDELQVIIPRGQNPYPLIEQIRGIVTQEIESNTKLADSEWLRVSQHYGVRAFSAEPSISVKQTDTGVVVIVRYITRALERAEVRYRLNHAFVKLLNQGEDATPPPGALPTGSETKSP